VTIRVTNPVALLETHAAWLTERRAVGPKHHQDLYGGAISLEFSTPPPLGYRELKAR